MWTIGAVELDLGLMWGGCKSCQEMWLIGSHAAIPSKSNNVPASLERVLYATWGHCLSDGGANPSDEAKVQSIIQMNLCMFFQSETRKTVYVISNMWTEMCTIEEFLITVICHWLQNNFKEDKFDQIWSLPLFSQVVLFPFYSGQRYLILFCYVYIWRGKLC